MENNEEIQRDNYLKPYPTLSQSWELFGWFVFISLFFQILSGFVINFINPSDLLKSWIILIVYSGSFFFLLLVIKFRTKLLGQAINIKFSAASISIFILLVPIILSLIIIVEPLSVLFPMPDKLAEIFKNLVQINVPSFLAVVVAAAFLEEIVCRGIILKGLLQNMQPWKAILWSALLFAALHMNPWQGIPAFIIGSFIGWVYYKTQSLWPCIFIHFINNGVAFALLALFSEPELTTSDLVGKSYYVPVYIGALLLSGIFIFLLNVYFNQKKRRDDINSRQSAI